MKLYIKQATNIQNIREPWNTGNRDYTTVMWLGDKGRETCIQLTKTSKSDYKASDWQMIMYLAISEPLKEVGGGVYGPLTEWWMDNLFIRMFGQLESLRLIWAYFTPSVELIEPEMVRSPIHSVDHTYWSLCILLVQFSRSPKSWQSFSLLCGCMT